MGTSILTLFCVLALVTKCTLSTSHCPKLHEHVRNTTCFHIFYKNVSNLTLNTFKKFDWKKIKCINLQDNVITSIQTGLFSKFGNLEILQVKNSPMLGAAIRVGFEGINSTRLTTLCLENVALSTSVVKYILGLLPHYLKHLILRNNTIKYFSLDFIRKFKIRTLVLSSNKNLDFSLGSIPKTYTWLKALDLSHTGSFLNSTFCPNNRNIIPSLKNLTLNGNLLRLSVIDQKKCVQRNLKHLSLSGCFLEDGLHKKSFFSFPMLKSLNLNGLNITTKIQLPSFERNGQLEVLNLNSIPYIFPPSDENTAAFTHLTKLNNLQMTQWNLSQWNSIHFSLLFKPISYTIQILDISSVGLSFIPDIVWNMQNLLILKMNCNGISKLAPHFNFTNEKLLILHLKWNRIQTLDPNLLPRSVTELNLTGNPFKCSCQLMPYVAWVKDKGQFTKVQGDWYNGRYRCQEPLGWKGKALAQFIFKVKRTDCLAFNVYVLTAIGLCFLMVVFVIVTNFVAWYKRKSNRKQKCGEEESLISSS